MKTLTHEAASLALVVELPDVAERDALIGYLYSESTDIEENPGVPGRSLERLYRSAAIEFGVRAETCRGIIEGE
jgi:hypothetical protein